MANTTLVRLNRDTYMVLHELAEQEGISMQELLSKAIEMYRREQFFEQARVAFARLQADPAAWQDYQQEQAELEGTLMDGLDPYEGITTAQRSVSVSVSR